MPQLRDAHTSSLIAEGTPTELVTIADTLSLTAGVVGPGETPEGLDAIYDDVGLHFDPDQVRKARDEKLEGLKAASTAKATPDTELREQVKQAHATALAELELAKSRAPEVQAALEQARAQVG